jgi:hypothetical protein
METTFRHVAGVAMAERRNAMLVKRRADPCFIDFIVMQCAIYRTDRYQGKK